MGRVINRSLLNTRRLSVNLVTYPEGHHAWQARAAEYRAACAVGLCSSGVITWTLD